MRVCQRESGRAVIEFAVGPADRVVAAFASSRESHLDVVQRGGRGVVILQVARGASRAREVVVVVDVAVEADSRGVGVRIG